VSIGSVSSRALAALLVLSLPARADGRDVDVGVSAGLGTPLGVIGGEVSTTVVGKIAVAGGVGLGAGGVAVAVEPRLFARRDRSGLYVGAGVSVAQEDSCYVNPEGVSICLVSSGEQGYGWWANVEVGYQHRTEHGFVRGYVGYSQMLNPAGVCLPDRQCLDQVPFLGLAFGRDLGGALARDEPVAAAEDQRAAALGVLADEAHDAARHGRCDLVRRIDAEVAAAAPAFHARVFAVDGSITACL
jgi:hypothetical protein